MFSVVKDLDKINRPSRLRRAILFDLDYLSTSKASPNDSRIVIIIIIAIGKLDAVVHRGADYSTELSFQPILLFSFSRPIHCHVASEEYDIQIDE